MDNLYLFVIAGVVIIILMIQYDSIQRKRLKKVLKQTNNVEPLFMMKSAGQQLNTLKATMAEYEKNLANIQDNGVLDKVKARLEETMHAYNEGRMPLQQYYDRLSNMNDVLIKHSAKEKKAIAVFGN
ncbi:hypothetical protein EOD41_15215 [Mucilaginibacter limnophilus]|uniref:LemA family protein n=1 Tax=Mucilaginibacter limnophilus TaxID=1932778 RepID=A0A3S2V6R6_9SPHI|nr:hypothetical protein [Mucilaginibacter limnophilus]RVT99790.1 hypothetical protein EOD41_15215 [Mucilaginibacter limnophilus]